VEPSRWHKDGIVFLEVLVCFLIQCVHLLALSPSLNYPISQEFLGDLVLSESGDILPSYCCRQPKLISNKSA
jgi:hypothetical protein